jgi:hypothetical protein
MEVLMKAINRLMVSLLGDDWLSLGNAEPDEHTIESGKNLYRKKEKW